MPPPPPLLFKHEGISRVECDGHRYGHLGASRGQLKALVMTPAPIA